MQKIVVDTNVIVSALIQNSYPHLIITELFIEQKFELCVSDELIAEYYAVLARPKFERFQDFYIRAEWLLAEIEVKVTKHISKIKLELISDKDDNKIFVI